MYLEASGSTCDGVDRSRTCNDGTFTEWSGSSLYTNISCTVIGESMSNCGNTPHGDYEIRTFFLNSTVPYGQTCGTGTTQRRQCNDGTFSTWDGNLVHQTCMVNDPPPPPPTTGNRDVRMFIFGHSLINHEHTNMPTEEKKVPHWLHQLTQTSNLNFTVDGQYGFLRNHADFSNIRPQWNFVEAQSQWTNENTSFANVDYNLILMTPANFVQYQAPNAGYYDDSTVSPLSATLQIFDQSRAAHPNIPFYIYENWPDMGSYGSFPNSIDISRYHNTTISGEFHNWFINYHDAALRERPGSNIKMIPVGPIISRLLRDTNLRDIPITSLYEDNAPHGQPTIYFLASLVTYMAIYQTPAPLNFTIPNTVHPLVRNNYSTVVTTIWTHLQNFNDSNGRSRVF